MKDDSKRDTRPDERPTKGGFLGLLRRSMQETSNGCGPGCGCHDDTEEKPDTSGQTVDKKAPQS